MGMFDHVEYECPCPHCGQALRDFQSKSGPCLLLTLKPPDVRDFYTLCGTCKKWVEFEVKVTAYTVQLVDTTKRPGYDSIL